VEEDEEVPGPLVQDPVQVAPVVAAELPQLAVDLGAVRNGSGGSLLATRFGRLILKSISSCRSGAPVDEVVDGLPAIRVAVVDGLHGVRGTGSA
jgi:hypothetical protein